MKTKLFNVEKVQLYPQSAQKELPKSFGIYKDTGEWLGTVGNTYEFTQPQEIYNLFSRIKKELSLKPDIQVKEFKGGKKLSFQLDLESFKIDTTSVVGDEVTKRLRFITSYDGSTSNFFDYILVRVRCTNGWTSEESLKSFKFRHTVSQEQKFKDLLAGITYALKYQKELEGLYQRSGSEVYLPTKENNNEFMKKLLGYNLNEVEEKDLTTRKVNKWNELENRIYQYTNDLGNNKWALFNAVTDYTNHYLASSRDKEEYVSFMTGKTINQKAHEILFS